MAWIARDKTGLLIFEYKPERDNGYWWDGRFANAIRPVTALDERLCGRKLTWEDEPVEI